MNLSVLFAALASLPLDHKQACAISLDSFIKKDQAELRIAEGEFGVSDKLLEVLNNDGGTPIAPKRNMGRPRNPNSKTSRIRDVLFPFMEERGGTVPSRDAIEHVKKALPDMKDYDVYNGTNQFVKQGTLKRDFGTWMLVSGMQEKVA